MSVLPADNSPYRRAAPADQVSLVDLIDRLLAAGVVVAGRVTLSIADVDLIDVSLHALLSSVCPPESATDAPGEAIDISEKPVGVRGEPK